MPFTSRSQIQKSEIIQDNMPVTSNFDNEGDNLSATQLGSNETLGKLVRWVSGMSRLLGETGRRKLADKFHGADVTLTGTITSSGTTITGSGTAFLTQLGVGDFIAGTADDFKEVIAIATDTSLTLASGFNTEITVGQAFKRLRTLAERLSFDVIPVGFVYSSILNSTPSGFLLCDGATYSRSTYSSLFSRMPSRTATATVTIATPCVVTWNAHGLATGQSIQFSTTGALPTGITAGTPYFIRRIDANTFHLYDTLANAMAGVYSGSTTGRVNTSGSQSGTHTAISLLYGNGDGSTTFNIPDLRGVVPRGAGTSAGYISSVSLTLGEKSDDQFQGHWHRSEDNRADYGAGTPAFSTAARQQSFAGSNRTDTPIADTANGTPRTGLETRPKSQAFNFYIKF